MNYNISYPIIPLFRNSQFFLDFFEKMNMIGKFSILSWSNNMHKSLLILLTASLFFWTGLSVSFAADPTIITDSNGELQIKGNDSPASWYQYTLPSQWGTETDNSLGWGTSGGKDDLMSTDFRLDPNGLSPSEKRYTGGTKKNLTDFLKTIGNTLLIATSTIAVLSIVVGGVMIATTGPSDRAAKGKTIITLNIIAIFVALFSYSLIRLVSWIIAA